MEGEKGFSLFVFCLFGSYFLLNKKVGKTSIKFLVFEDRLYLTQLLLM